MPLSDFWKTLLSATLGFLAGLLAEPLRLLITSTVRLREMRTALYRDAICRYWDLVQFVYKGQGKEFGGKSALGATRRYIRDDLLEHFHSTDPANLYRLKEFRELENYYTHLRSLKRMEFPTSRDYDMYMRDILNMFDYYVRSGRLSRWKAYRCGGRHLRKHWRDDRARYSQDSFQELL
jgi:hypothetical protein